MTKMSIVRAYDLPITLSIACIGGFLGNMSHLPGGAILGALIAVGIIKLVMDYSSGALPKYYTFVLQVLAGIWLGSKFGVKEVFAFPDIILPAILSSLTLLLIGILSTFLVTKLFGWDIMTAWLSCSPGRMQDMLIIANDYGIDSVKITLTHTVRIFLVVSISPLVLYWINFFN